jgi:hypothetical protein
MNDSIIRAIREIAYELVEYDNTRQAEPQTYEEAFDLINAQIRINAKLHKTLKRCMDEGYPLTDFQNEFNTVYLELIALKKEDNQWTTQ